MPNDIIKVIQIGTVPYDISALYIQDGSGNNKTWQDILNLVQAGFTIEAPWTAADYASTTAPTTAKLATVPAITVYYSNGTKTATGTLAASNAETKKHIYLIYHPNHNPSTSDTYDEYVSSGSGTSAVWEKVGNTDIDLSDYALRTEAGKAGTYNTSSSSAANSGLAGGGTVNTSSNGSQTATGTATVTIPAASFPTATGSGGASESANTGTGGGVTINGSNFTFTGTTATLSQAAGTGTVKIDNHSYTPAGTIGGSQSIAAHSHTVNAATASITYVTGATTSTAGAHSHTVDSHTHAANVTVVTGVASGGTATAISGVTTTGATISVTSNVLQLPTYVLTSATQSGSNTVIKSTGLSTSTAAGVPSAATLTSSEVAAHSHTVNVAKSTATFVTGATLGTAGAATINGSNFSFTGTAATLEHTQTATATTAYKTLNTSVPAVSISYQPAGTIGGSQSVAAHSHSYDKPKNHTHGITFSSITVTGTAAVAVSSHTHSVTISSHSHTIAHTHNVTVPPISPTV